MLNNSLIFAQSTGKIAGKIIDKKTGESLIGATVLIEGSAKGTAANIDGNYVLANVNPGKHTLIVKYIGYSSKQISEVEVKAKNVTHLDVVLDEPANNSLKEVVVSGTYRQESVTALYAQQKNSIQITDGITADVIRRSPDRNTGEVLKRVSGTSVQDGKFIVVRGLADRYNVNMLNNAILPSTEPDKKAFSFDIIPSNLVDNIVIYKTATPDLPGDLTGGAVKIITRDMPESKFFEATVNMGYNSKTTFKSNFTDPAPHGALDFLGFDDGSRKLPAAYRDNKTNYTSGLTGAQKIDIASKFPDSYAYETGKTSLPNWGVQLSAGNSKTTKNDGRFAYIFALNYRSAHQVVEGSRVEYNPSNTGTSNNLINYQFNRTNAASTRALGSVLNLAYTYGKNKISWRNLYNNDFNINFEQTSNALNFEADQHNPLRYKGFAIETTQNGLYSSVVEGQHGLGKRNVQVNWNASYGLSYRNMPDQRIVTVFTPLGQPEYISFSSENSPKPNDLGRIYSSLHENIYGAGANVTYPFKWISLPQQFKAGGLFAYRSRNFTTDALGYVDEAALGSSQIPLTGGLTVSNIFSPESIKQHNIAFARLDLSSIDYDGTANLNAGYLMLNNTFTEKLHLIWGARIENYNQTLTAAGKVKRDYINTDVLPSANLTYNLSPKTNLRLAYFKSVNRPEFREIADYRFFDYQNNFIIAGNDKLVRSTVNNADIRLEFYPSGGEIISVSGFYKKFRNPIEQVNMGNTILSYDNAISATDLGAEMEIRKKLAFIDVVPFFRNVTFYVNASYINAKVSLPGRNASTPLQGQSPYLINSGLYYLTEESGLSFNILYNRIGQRLAFRGQGTNIDIYEKPRDVVDFQIGKQLLHKRAELKLTCSDIFQQATSLYYNYGAINKTAYNPKEDKIIQKRFAGFSTMLSFRYNISSAR